MICGHIQKYGAINSLESKLNPTTTSWWIRLNVLKIDQLKIVSEPAYLNYKEVIIVLEAIYQQRFIKSISLMRFLKKIHECGLKDVDSDE